MVDREMNQKFISATEGAPLGQVFGRWVYPAGGFEPAVLRKMMLAGPTLWGVVHGWSFAKLDPAGIHKFWISPFQRFPTAQREMLDGNGFIALVDAKIGLKMDNIWSGTGWRR